MANPERGEIDLTVGGRTYTLKLSMNAAVALEKKLNKSIGDIMRDAGNLKFQSIRTVIWLLLQKYHATDFKTEESVGDLIDEAGGVGTFFTVLKELADANRADATGGADGENPPEAQSGTGEPSTSSPGDSV
jgi:hypothetical protein